MAKNRKTPDMNLPMWFDGQNINEALFAHYSSFLFLQDSLHTASPFHLLS